MKKFYSLSLVLFIGLSIITVNAKNVYANASTGNDSKDGLSSANAVATLAKAYSLVASGDVVNLSGKFILDDDFVVKIPVSFKGDGTAVIDGDGGFTGIKVDAEGSFISISNITFKNCYGTNGGAINILGASTTYSRGKMLIQDCVFDANQCSGLGGALAMNTHATGGESLTIDRCVFKNNISGNHGGAFTFLPEGVDPGFKPTLNIYNTTFAKNSCKNAGGICIIDGNKDAIESSEFNIVNVTASENFTANNVGNGGGFIFIVGPNPSAVTVKMSNSIFEGNYTTLENAFSDFGFSGPTTGMTVKNSIIGRLYTFAGAFSTATSISSNINSRQLYSESPVSGIGAFTGAYYPLTNTSLAYNYGSTLNIPAQYTLDQQKLKRGSTNQLCSSGSVEFLSPVAGLKEGHNVTTKAFAVGGKVQIKGDFQSVCVIGISGATIGSYSKSNLNMLTLNKGAYILKITSISNSTETTKLIVD